LTKQSGHQDHHSNGDYVMTVHICMSDNEKSWICMGNRFNFRNSWKFLWKLLFVWFLSYYTYYT